MNSLLSQLEFDIAMSTSSLQCLRLDAAIRTRAAEALSPTSKMKVSNIQNENDTFQLTGSKIRTFYILFLLLEEVS